MKTLVVIAGLAVSTLAGVNAQTLLYEIFSGPTPSTSSVPLLTRHADVSSATGYIADVGVNFYHQGDTFSVTAFDITNTSFADAIDDGDVITWSFSLGSAYNLSEFGIRMDRSSRGPGNVRIDLDVGAGFVTVLTISGLNQGGQEYLDVDLSSFTNVTAGTFRLVAFGGTDVAGIFDFENTANLNNASFQLSGSAVPEPGTLAFLSLGAAFAFLRNRRRSMS